MSRFPISSASLNALQPPPAIVQQEKNFAWHIQQLEDCEERFTEEWDKRIKALKESGTWRETYKTWEACSEIVLGISKRHADRRIARVGQKCPEVGNKQDKQEQKALSQVEKARETKPAPAPEPEEEPEKPAVHSADEVKPETNGHPKPRDNGKPKTQLPIWKEIEEDLIGKAYRRVDDLNRLCLNPVHHKRMITALKMCHGILDEWRRDTK